MRTSPCPAPSRLVIAASIALIIVLATIADHAQAEDRIEFLSGATLKGTVSKIDAAGKTVKFEATIAGRKTSREFSYAQIHAVNYRGKRYVLTAKAAKPTNKSNSGSTNDRVGANIRSKSEIEKLISTVGSAKPDWFDSTPAGLPKSLDLSFPLKPPNKGWNNQVNVGQYIWDVINPNPSRWKSGIVMMHQLMDGHQRNAELLSRDKKAIAAMYFRFFQDYPRAVYWYRQANIKKGTPESIMLAECYFRMGNKAMAMELLNSRTLTANAIKLLGDMSETQRAIQLAELYAKAGRDHEAYLMAGDACRQAAQYPRAISFYEKVLTGKSARNKEHEQRFHGRAKDSIEAIRYYELLDLSKLDDGKYTAQSPGYSGPIEVEVTVANKRISDVKVTKHREKQFYSALTDTTSQIIQKQGVKGVDTTSRATITSAAIVNASARALAK